VLRPHGRLISAATARTADQRYDRTDG